jgi:hypothetical protein
MASSCPQYVFHKALENENDALFNYWISIDRNELEPSGIHKSFQICAVFWPRFPHIHVLPRCDHQKQFASCQLRLKTRDISRNNNLAEAR